MEKSFESTPWKIYPKKLEQTTKVVNKSASSKLTRKTGRDSESTGDSDLRNRMEILIYTTNNRVIECGNSMISTVFDQAVENFWQGLCEWE